VAVRIQNRHRFVSVTLKLFYRSQTFSAVFDGWTADGDFHVLCLRCFKVLASREIGFELSKVFDSLDFVDDILKSFSCFHRYWWRNALYINNLFSHDELCMNWTWSMACEMQFFAVFTLILFIYAK
jgi:hypothetical protein